MSEFELQDKIAIVPGLIDTEEQRRGGLVPPDKNEDGSPVPPTLYPPGPEEVGNLAVFLASADKMQRSRF